MCQRLTPSLTHKYANAFVTIQVSFYSPNRACVLQESGRPPHSAKPLECSKTPPTLGIGLLRVMTTQKYFTLGAGPAFCGSVNSGRRSNAMSFRPRSPHAPAFLTLLVVSANNSFEKHRGHFVYCQHKMRLLFSTTLTVRGSQNPS